MCVVLYARAQRAYPKQESNTQPDDNTSQVTIKQLEILGQTRRFLTGDLKSEVRGCV